MLSSSKLRIFAKVYVLVIFCIVTVGVASAYISSQVRSASKEYFASDANPAKVFIPSYEDTQPLKFDADAAAERGAALEAAAVTLQRIQTIGWCVDALVQLVIILIFSIFLTNIISREKIK